MSAIPPIAVIQRALVEQDVDGWLLWDFRGQNPLAARLLDLEGQLLTRRWAYFVPRAGEPTLLVHRIEAGSLPPRPGDVCAYRTRDELHDGLRGMLAGSRRIAMEYVPGGEIPYLSRVDAGTIELIRTFGVEVVSSADLVQHFLCRLSPDQIGSHRRAAAVVDRIKDEAFAMIGERNRSGRPALETEVQAFVSERFRAEGLVTDHSCIVAVDAHAGNPHYVPRPGVARACAPGTLVLLDLWAREDHAEAVYADITWIAFCGAEVPERIAEVFGVVTAARDLGVETVREAWAAERRIEGREVDRAVRDFIAAKGYGEQFLHRTGHNIGHAVHGDGAHLDDFETRDGRALVPGLCFSIEPGIYLDDFGIRSEIDVVLEADGPHVYTPAQRDIVRIA